MGAVYWLLRNSTRALISVLYRHKVYGVDHIYKGGALLCPNHLSYLDPPIIGASWPEEVAFLARRTLFEIPFLNWMIRSCNAYPVKGGLTDNLASLKLTGHLVQEGKKVVIFPEGERSHNGTLGPIKAGIGMLVLRYQCCVIPAYIHGSYEIFKRGRRFPKLWGKTACVFGTPISWEEFAGMEKKEAQQAIADRIRQSILNLAEWYESGAQGNPP